MANDLQNMMDTLIMPAALPVLREACALPALVSQDFSAQAAEQNETIRVPLPQDMGTADDFVPATGSSSTDLDDPKVDITLKNWKYKQFQMNDQEMRETITSGVLPSAAEAAIKSLANSIDLSLWDLYKKVPYVSGTPGQAMDADADVIQARKSLQDTLAPPEQRRLVVNTQDEADLLALYTNADKTGSTEALRNASLGRLYGFDTYYDQLAPDHTSGDAWDSVTPAINSASVAVGDTAVPMDGFTATGWLRAGDVFTVAGDSQPYVVQADAQASTNAIASVSFYPAAKVAWADDAGVTFVGPVSTTYRQSMGFNRNAFMFAARTLSSESSESSSISVATDPISGIPLRLETWRSPQYSTRFWRFDILYGVEVLRHELAVRVYGGN